MAQRAEDTCEELARQRDYSGIDVVHIRPHGSDMVEVELRARQRGNRVSINCLYDDDQRQALFTDQLAPHPARAVHTIPRRSLLGGLVLAACLAAPAARAALAVDGGPRAFIQRLGDETLAILQAPACKGRTESPQKCRGKIPQVTVPVLGRDQRRAAPCLGGRPRRRGGGGGAIAAWVRVCAGMRSA